METQERHRLIRELAIDIPQGETLDAGTLRHLLETYVVLHPDDDCFHMYPVQECGGVPPGAKVEVVTGQVVLRWTSSDERAYVNAWNAKVEAEHEEQRRAKEAAAQEQSA